MSARSTLVTVLSYQTITTTTNTDRECKPSLHLQYLVSRVVVSVPTPSPTQLTQSVCTTITLAVCS